MEGSESQDHSKDPKGKKQKREEVFSWSINTGGLSGTWKVLHLLEGLKGRKPSLVCMQEVAATKSQWIVISRYA